MFCSIFILYLQDSDFKTPEKFFTMASEHIATALLSTKEIKPNKRVIILIISIQT